MEKLFLVAVFGLLAQMIDGSLGMAYGVTATTLLLATGATARAASACVHLAEVGTTLASGLSHWRFGNVNWRTVVWLGVPGAVGAFVGANVLTSLDAAWMKPWTSAVLFGLGVYILFRFARGLSRKPLAENHLRPRFFVPLGLVGGFIDAVGGGGWGPVTTPALLTAGRMEPRKAIGSASMSEFLVASAASLGFLFGLRRQLADVPMALALLAGGLVAAPIAAAVVRRLSARQAGTLVGALILVTNARTLLLAAKIPDAPRLAMLVALASLLVFIVAAVWRDERARSSRGRASTESNDAEAAAPVAVVVPVADRVTLEPS